MSPSDKLSQLSSKDQFYHIFGQAMAAWSEVEYGLSLWFSASTDLEYRMAQNLFFSGRSFAARRNLLAAALASSDMPSDWCGFAIECLDKARCYDSQRNRLAHGIMHTNKTDSETGQPIDWKLKEQDQWESDTGLDYETVSVIAKNFQALADIIRESYYPYVRSWQPQEFIQRLRVPPGPANAGGLNNSGNDPSGAGNSAKSPDAPGMRTPGTNAAGTANSSGSSVSNTAASRGSTTVGTAGNRAGGTSSGNIDGTVTSGGPDRPGGAEIRAEDVKVDQKIKSICKGC
jgi:hypothetical protein